MKKILALLLAVVMVLGLAACGNGSNNDDGSLKVAMVTDYGDITDQSFNQTTYEAGKAWAEENGVAFNYYKPAGDSTSERVAMIDMAVSDGYNVILLPGYAFAGAIYETQDAYPDVTFIALDVAEWDLEDAFYNHDADGNRTTLIDESNEPHVASNVFSAVYQEELSGYLAGYAAVKLGYTHLGYLGGMAVPAVQRFGYGYLQGIDAAAAELGIADDVTVEWVYGNLFASDPDITAVMDTWYAEKGVEVVFACGGGIYGSAAEAAAKVGGKVIGVDVDQAATIDGTYGEGMTVTSAMKGLAPTVKTLLDAVKDGKFSEYGGKVMTMGLVSKNPEDNFVQIPMESTQWEDGKFTQDDYKAMVAAMYNGEITVNSAIDAMPVVNVVVNDYGTIK